MTYVPGPNASKQDNPLNIKRFAEHAVIADGHTPPENTVDKDTNPKDTIGSGKLPLSLVPSTLVMYASLAFLEGALKYGRFNWRVAGVRSSIYIDALERHLAKYKNGEDIDPHTGVPHLSSMLACLGILVDAKVCDKLNDDRPPRAPISGLIDEMAEDVGRLKAQFKDHHPHQYTIEDSMAEKAIEFGKKACDKISKLSSKSRPNEIYEAMIEECEKRGIDYRLFLRKPTDAPPLPNPEDDLL